MTLIISIASPKGLWQCSDVRLSLNGNPLSKPGMKHIRLNCHDGRALIGYSGVGKVGEIEISKWVRQALRGYKGGIEDTLKMLTDLANSELNKYTLLPQKIPHTFSVPAFVGRDAYMYLITNRDENDQKELNEFRFIKTPAKEQTINIEGSGKRHIPNGTLLLISRTISRRENHENIGKEVSALMAYITKQISIIEPTVSKTCLITYVSSEQNPPESKYYNKEKAEEYQFIGVLENGMDILAILEPIFPTVRESLIRNLDRIQKGEKFEEDQGIEDKIKEILKKIDLKPRKKL